MRISLEVSNSRERMFKELEQLHSLQEYNKRKIVFFGANIGTELGCLFFQKRGIDVSCIIDNDRLKQGKKVNNVPIASFENFSEKFYDNALVFVASSAYEAMKKQLEEIGYIEKVHIYQIKNFIYQKENEISKSYKQKGYIPLTLREVQKKTVEILLYVHEICEKNSLRYCVAYGSLLGAVRHKGAIPWDDDIDLLMPLQDFKKFCGIMVEDKNYGIYSAFTSTEDETAISTLLKVMDMSTVAVLNQYPLLLDGHVGIDVFPLGGYPSDTDEQSQYYLELREYYQKWNSEIWCNYGTADYQYSKQEEMLGVMLSKMERYNYEECEYVGSVACVPYNPVISKKELFEKRVLLDYEGKKFYCPSGWHEILQASYGDFMKYPSESVRKPSHFYNAHSIVNN